MKVKKVGPKKVRKQDIKCDCQVSPDGQVLILTFRGTRKITRQHIVDCLLNVAQKIVEDES